MVFKKHCYFWPSNVSSIIVEDTSRETKYGYYNIQSYWVHCRLVCLSIGLRPYKLQKVVNYDQYVLCLCGFAFQCNGSQEIHVYHGKWTELNDVLNRHARFPGSFELTYFTSSAILLDVWTLMRPEPLSLKLVERKWTQKVSVFIVYPLEDPTYFVWQYTLCCFTTTI